MVESLMESGKHCAKPIFIVYEFQTQKTQPFEITLLLLQMSDIELPMGS